MVPLTPENLRARRTALWICSTACLAGLAAMPAAGAWAIQARNPIALILLLMLFTGIMHAWVRELRMPALALALLSIAGLLVLFSRGGHP